MNTKKILAVAAVALMSVPAYAAATQIVVGGLREQIVEGHTVFAVIEKARFRNVTEEAAAVAVLVRERAQECRNFKGVLWFNDQYLVSPRNSCFANTRYPCGGSVLAVNAGDPDPRTMLVEYNRTDAVQSVEQAWFDPGDDSQDVLSQDGNSLAPGTPGALTPGDYSIYGVDPTPDPNVEPQTQQSAGTPAGATGVSTPGATQPANNAWIGIDDPDGTGPILPNVSTSLTTGIPFLYDYNESYFVTDPNDHAWIVDKYDGITVDSVNLNTGDLVETTTTFPLWAVNILGKPVFTPDDGETSCSPFVDDPWQQGAINENFAIADTEICSDTSSPIIPGAPTATTCPSNPPGFGADGDGDGLPTDGLDVKPPAIGYYEPTDPAVNPGSISYCYDGNAMPRPGDNARNPGTGCEHQMTYLPPGPDAWDVGLGLDLADRVGNHPLRLYNALLYFWTEDCDTGSHSNDVRAAQCRVPHGVLDTNGCQVGTEWHCPTWVQQADGTYIPGAENDDMEGNSHPFNPPGLYVPTVFDPTAPPGTPLPGTGTWYDFWAINRACSLGYSTVDTDVNGQKVCNRNEHIEHDRGLIDIYFSPMARPLEPPVRSFAVLDFEGRIDQFHENNPNPNATPGEPGHAGVPDTDLAPGGIRRPNIT